MPTTLQALAGRRVLVTGHTGFKGSWLTVWLLALGAEVTGLSLGVPTAPSMFELLDLGSRIRHVDADIRDPDAVRRVVRRARPDVVVHLAAQPLVPRSYRDPLETLATNVLGTAHVLDALRGLDHPVAAVVVTSDKCYRNGEWPWAYRESDHLGGADPYSASKAAAELVTHAYVRSFLGSGGFGTGNGPGTRDGSGGPVQVVTARAGNVIGGGDWAADRVVPDCVRAWERGGTVLLRRPGATRPWQHVLEPLAGYLVLAAELLAAVDRGEVGDLHGESFNFGPAPTEEVRVVDIVTGVAAAFGHPDPAGSYQIADGTPFPEAGRLRLDSAKALQHLGWRGVLDPAEMMELTGGWYRRSVEPDGTAGELVRLTVEQIRRYTALASERGLDWAQPEGYAAQQPANPSANVILGSQPGSRSPVFHGTMTSRSR